MVAIIVVSGMDAISGAFITRNERAPVWLKVFIAFWILLTAVWIINSAIFASGA